MHGSLVKQFFLNDVLLKVWDLGLVTLLPGRRIPPAFHSVRVANSASHFDVALHRLMSIFHSSVDLKCPEWLF